MILLTDEEILEATQVDMTAGYLTGRRQVAKTQLNKVMKWGISPCYHKDGPLFKRECPHCWQALLEEVRE